MLLRRHTHPRQAAWRASIKRHGAQAGNAVVPGTCSHAQRAQHCIPAATHLPPTSPAGRLIRSNRPVGAVGCRGALVEPHKVACGAGTLICDAILPTGMRQPPACGVLQQGMLYRQPGLQHVSKTCGGLCHHKESHGHAAREADLQHPPSHVVSCRGPGRAVLGLAHAEAGVIQLLLGQEDAGQLEPQLHAGGHCSARQSRVAAGRNPCSAAAATADGREASVTSPSCCQIRRRGATASRYSCTQGKVGSASQGAAAP